MTSIVTIQKRLCINPNFLDNKLKYKMFNFVKEITKNECTKDNGYIIEIIKITKINNNYISGNNCEIIFEVDVEAEVLKPEINKTFKDKVCMIFNGGIFIDVKEKFKILVPLTALHNFVFDQENKNFKNEKTSFVINESQ